MVGPWLLAQPWRAVVPDGTAMMLRFGIVKQALPDPADPILGQHSAEYRAAIEHSLHNGRLYTGLRSNLAAQLTEKLFPYETTKPAAVFLHLVRKYPARYGRALLRTAMLFAGVKGLENENDIFREQILSAVWPGSKIGDGPEPMSARIKEEFLQRAAPSTVLSVSRVLTPVFESVLPWCFAAALVTLVIALARRQYELFWLALIPVFYLTPSLFALAAIDRYAFPVYPIVLAVCIASVTEAIRAALFRSTVRRIFR
jgi:hypothetical protein